MSGDVHQGERQAILTRLLYAVKQCQVRFGGRSELATDSDSRVLSLCAALESALQHGMKRNNTALSTLKQMTEKSGLIKVTNLFSDMRHIETDPVFWHYAREHLSKDELQRFSKLNLVNTDLGRGRAWLRASLNEQALERYMLMLIESDEMLSQYYEDWAFLRDVERNSMLPNMAAGLGSILFAVTVDRPDLNGGHTAPVSFHTQSNLNIVSVTQKEEEPTPVISESVSSESSGKKKDKRKKKKLANVVIFDEVGTTGTVMTRTSRSGSTGLPYNVKQHLYGEARGNGDGTPDTSMLVSEDFVGSGDKEGSREPSLSALVQSQMSSLSIGTRNSDTQTSVESSNDGHDSSTFLAPVGSDGLVMDSDMIPVCSASATQFWSHGLSCATDSHKHQIKDASLTIEIAQHSLQNSSYTSTVYENLGNPKTTLTGSMSHDELKQAVVAMMLTKDLVQEQNRKLEGIVQQEIETSSTLKAEIEELKSQYAARREKEQTKLQALQKENELLKQQLKKYVTAVQLLKTEGINKEDTLGIHLEDPQPSLPSPKSVIDYSHEAAEYEKKLIQVAEMHGELIEFNELLHRQLGAKDVLMKQLREELTVLRGPLPCDRQIFRDAGQDLDSMCLHRPLINIWIPSAFLRGNASNTHHVYQVYIRIRDEEWNVYKRYSQFLDTHLRLKKVYPIIGTFEIPPKRTIGKKEAKLVESRRQMLQTYLRNVINLMLEKSPEMAANVNKEKLISVLPFFNDNIDEKREMDRK